MTLRKEIRDYYGGPQSRDFSIRAADADKEARTVKLSFSSETPIARFWGIEVLSHRSGACRIDRLVSAGSLLENHEREKRLGPILEARCSEEEKKGYATVRFGAGARAQEVLQDVLNEDWTTVSVGYMVHSARELKPEEMDDSMKAMALREKLPVVLIEEWEPYEISMVSIPADVTVGVGRNLSHTPNNINSQGSITMSDEVKVPTPSPDEVLQKERERVAEIKALAATNAGRVPKLDELEREAFAKGWTPERFKGEMWDRMPTPGPVETPKSAIGLSENEAQSYSIARAILHQLDPRIEAGFEVECNRELERRFGKARQGAFRVPYEVQARQMHPDKAQFYRVGRRDLLTSSAVSAGNLVGTQLAAASFIELLRHKMLMTQLGVNVLSGLVGNIAIPRQTGTSTAVWTTEGTGVNSESTQTYDQVSLSPNEVGAYTDISRKLIQQATPGVEGLIESDIAKTLAIAIDLAILHGSGGTQPTGIASTSGIGAVDGASLDWEAIVEFLTDVATSDADVASMAYVTNPTVMGMLKTRPKVAGFPAFLMDADGTMNGYKVAWTNQVSSGYMFFGDYSQVILAEWGVLEILVNPFRQDVEGLIRITGYQSVDVGVRHAGAFSMSSTVS